MAVQIKHYEIFYRDSFAQDFELLVGSGTDNRVQANEIALAYAEDHPGRHIQIVANGEVEMQYRLRNGQMYYSFGNGWMPYYG